MIDEKKFDFTLSRDTFGNKVLIGCEINVESNEGNIFGSVYDVKIQMIGIFNRFCENSNIFSFKTSIMSKYVRQHILKYIKLKID